MSLFSRLFIPAILKRCNQTYNNVFSDLSFSRYYSDSLDDKACSERNRKQQKIICNDEWRKRLSPDEYYVTREKGTEPPFSGKYYNHCDEGVYKCICCSSDLFSSAEKYESHCGWPSFYSPILTKLQDGQSPVKTKLDTNHGMVRTEVLCGECDAHLGHVFDDGPKPTGLRYCINSVALKFIPKKG